MTVHGRWALTMVVAQGKYYCILEEWKLFSVYLGGREATVYLGGREATVYSRLESNG